MDVYYCPQCNSEEIETVVLSPPPVRISMDDMGRSDYLPLQAIHISYKYQSTCTSCGYAVTYTR